MALLPQIQYGNPLEDGVNLYNAGLKLGTQQREQNALRDVGQLLAAGNQKGARNALYGAGMVDQGLKLDDRMTAQADKAQARALAMQERRQALALKAQGALANIADTIQTPEQFEMAKGMLANAGMDVSKYTFDQLPILRAQAIDAKTRMELALKQQLADAKTGAGTNATTMPPALQKALATQDAKTQKEYGEAAQGASDIQRDLESLKTSRDQTNFEGSWFNNALTRAVGRNIGGDGYVVPTSKDVQALDEINTMSGNLTLSASTKLKGVLSESDMALVKSTVPSASITDAASGKIITGMEAGAQRAQDRAAMYDAWLETHGSSRGFQRAWAQFARDNPVFSKDQSGAIIANVQPKKDWAQYLGVSTEQERAPASSGKQKLRYNPETDDFE